jgi:hypothetical protein
MKGASVLWNDMGSGGGSTGRAQAGTDHARGDVGGSLMTRSCGCYDFHDGFGLCVSAGTQESDACYNAHHGSWQLN